MDNIVTKLFEAGLLSEADQVSLQESFEARVQSAVNEAREQAVVQVREEMTQRFEHDKGALVEAIDRMLTDVVQRYEAGAAEQTSKLREAQEKLEATKEQMKASYKARIKEHAKVLESFVMNKLSSELGEFNEDKTAVSQLRLKLAATLAESKAANKSRLKEQMSLMRKFVVEKLDVEITSLRNQRRDLDEAKTAMVATLATKSKQLQEAYAGRIQKMDKFVVEKIAQELNEFQADKRALVEKRVELVTTAKAKIAETQRNFIKEAAKLVNVKVTSALKSELTQLHEDLERNRQNMLGRRIFEAIAAEFKTSYLNESVETTKLEAKLAEQANVIAEAKRELLESKNAAEAANRKAKLAEDATLRIKTMSELLSPLTRDKQAVMQELLGTVKTTQLREAFTKYLPAVLNEGGKKSAPQSRQTLSEAPKEKSTVTVTGNQRVNRLLETVQADNTDIVSTETATILKLAGIKK